jgi:predicted Zn finger-like uncharacterized protein
MYTQCAECLTIYKIQAQSLKASHGKFRCGHCGTVFDALPTLVESLPEGLVAELPRAEHSDAPVVLSVPALRPVRQSGLFAEMNLGDAQAEPLDLREFDDPVSGTRIEPTLPADWVVYRPGDAAPTPVVRGAELDDQAQIAKPKQNAQRSDRYSGVESGKGQRAQYDLGQAPAKLASIKLEPRSVAAPLPKRPTHTDYADYAPGARRWPWVLGCLSLCIALLVQLGFYQKKLLLAHDDFRPVLEQICALFGCQLPLRSDLARLRVLESDVRPHPRMQGALIISASLTNDARFVQAYPMVEVKLLSAAGQPVALRRFAPESYLRDSAAKAVGIGPNASLPIVFEVLDPGAQADGFEFNFIEGEELVSDSTPPG